MSLNSWTYTGSDQERASTESGRQHALACDEVYDDELGVGLLDRLDGTKIWIEFGRSGEPKEVKERPAQHVFAVKSRAPPAPAAKTGRCSGGMASISSFFGASSSDAQPTANTPAKRGGRGSKPFNPPKAGSKRGRGRSSGGGSSSSCGAADAGADLETPEKRTAHFNIGAEDADEDEQDGNSSEPVSKRAKAGAVGVRHMSPEGLATYRKEKYQERQAATTQAAHRDEYPWLSTDKTRGFHCKVCIVSLIKASDKLSTSGYGVQQDGQPKPYPSKQKLDMHQDKDQHKANMRAAREAQAKGHEAHTDGRPLTPPGSIKTMFFITPEDDLYARTIRTIHLVAKRQLALSVMHDLLELQNANGLVISFDHAAPTGVDDGGLGTWLHAGARVFQRRLLARATPPLITKKLFPNGVPFGLMGDGSNDRSMAQQEAVVLRFVGSNGRPFNSFIELAQLDLSKSEDGHSPDAKCITACYAESLDKLDKREGFLFRSSWQSSLVGVSFDGASVMLGSQNGVASKLNDMTKTHLCILHAVAHVQQLGNADAFSRVEYYEEWCDTIQDTYIQYSQSGKKSFSLQEIAGELGESLLKLKGKHGIRWAAAQLRSIKALFIDLPTIVVELECRAKSHLGFEYTLLTASNSFLQKQFFHKFEGEGGKKSRWKATVIKFAPSSDGISASDIFTVSYSNKQTMEMTKAELVDKLSDSSSSKLAGDECWQLRSKLVDYRFVAFTSFMMDIHGLLSVLSRSYQSNSLTVFDIPRNLNRTLTALKKLESTKGEHEKAFLAACAENDNACCLRSCQLEDVEEGRKLFTEDRSAILIALSEELTDRFLKVLDDPIIQAFSIFDHKKWPSSKNILTESFTDELELLFNTYKPFFPESTQLTDLQEQWKDIKIEINGNIGLSSRTFHELWPHMLIHFSDEYPDVLRLVVIVLLIPTDTSECERIFSLMNDLKTAERSRLGEKLSDLMMWHVAARTMPCSEVPVLDILHEFRALAGIRGRNAHRGHQPPEYDHKVKVEIEDLIEDAD